MMMPKSARQYSVCRITVSCKIAKTDAPTIGPVKVWMPPSSTITSPSIERPTPIVSGEIEPLAKANSPPATPQTASPAPQPPSTGPSAGAPGAATPAAAAATQTGVFSVLIKAREDSWVSITADGNPIIEDTLPASAEKSVEAHNQIVIKSGNVGALDISFNGRQLAPQGHEKQVKTLTFDSDGLRPK